MTGSSARSLAAAVSSWTFRPAEYMIRGGAVDSIRVRWETRDSRENDSVRTEVAVKGSDATIRVRGPKNNFHVTMDVPAIADIQMDVSAGEVSVRGVEGNKSVSMWAGEVTMEVGDAQLYRSVDTTVRFGEIQASPFGGSKGGVLRSFRWDGSGESRSWPSSLPAKSGCK